MKSLQPPPPVTRTPLPEHLFAPKVMKVDTEINDIDDVEYVGFSINVPTPLKATPSSSINKGI